MPVFVSLGAQTRFLRFLDFYEEVLRHKVFKKSDFLITPRSFGPKVRVGLATRCSPRGQIDADEVGPGVRSRCGALVVAKPPKCV